MASTVMKLQALEAIIPN